MLKSRTARTGTVIARAATGPGRGDLPAPTPRPSPTPRRSRRAVEPLEGRCLFSTLPSGFTESLVATGLSSPTAMEFAPDGRVFVTQQDGNLRVIKNGQLKAAPFVTLPADSTGERGLLGVTVDPNFAANKYLYVYYTTAAGTGESHNRVSRFTATGDTAPLSSEQVLLDLPAVGGGTWHMGGAMKFGIDGKLFVAVGDYQVPANAMSLDIPAGKILRFNADGSIPTDNPFYAQTTGVNKAIWARGMRNPFTLAVQAGTGRLYINEVGQSGWEEVNEGAAGANYGWPGSEGATTIAGYTSPVYTYTHAEGICVIGGAFYSGVPQVFPAQYAGKYFFGDFGGGWIRTLDPVTKVVTPFASGLQFPTGFSVGTDGSLWYLSRGAPSGGLPNTGQVFRIAYDAFAAPAVNLQPGDQVVSVGDPVTFEVEASGGGTLAYQWKKDGTAIAGATAPRLSLPSVTLADSGAQYTCTVTSAYGTVTTRQAVLTVTVNQRPTATITSPVAGTTFAGAQTISYAATATDAEDGVLPASAFTWQVDYHTGAVTRPFLLPTSGVKGGSFEVPTETPYTEADVFFRVTVTVTDSTGLSYTTSTDVAPRTAAVTLATNVPGAKVEIDGQPKAGPYTTVGVVGLRRTVGVPLVQTVNGVTYQFDRWSDGGDATHSVFLPAANTTYTAMYVARQATYVSDLPFAGTPTNNWGPVERDLSNGEAAAGDGRIIKLNGVSYPKGLGVHANAEVSFDLGGQYERFISDVGVDDEVDNAGSVIFQVWADGVKLFDSGLMAGPSDTQTVNVDVSGKLRLKLVVLNGGDDGTLDHASWGGARLLVPLTPPPPAPSTVYASDLPFAGTPVNEWGPVERDQSNGENAAGDGRTITLAGVAYAKGIGTHANSEVRIDLGGRFSIFQADVGVDDEEGNTGSVVFQVWADGVKLYDSGVVYGSSPTKAVDVYVTGAQQLRLVLTDGGDNVYNDHADWAAARLTYTPGLELPALSVADAAAFEGDAGTGAVVFTVTRATGVGTTTVAYATTSAGGTATPGAAGTAGADYAPTSGVLTFAPGELTKTVSVPVFGDLAIEDDETFSLVLSNPTNGTLAAADATATGTIATDDLSELTVTGGSVTEGNAGTKNLTFTITRPDATGTAAVTFSTADITAVGGGDYTPVSGTVTFAAGELTKTVVVPVLGDLAVEADETFSFQLLDATNATIGDVDFAVGTIVNDDLPTISVAEASVAEGNSGTTNLVFTVTRSAAAVASTVKWATGAATGTAAATAGTDYTAASGTLSFAVGELSKTFTVKVTGETTIEPDETLLLTLTQPTGATLARAQATGTIVNDDVASTIAIADARVTEGKSGTTSATFTVTRTSGTGTASVKWATANFTATVADADYTAASGTVSFAAGETSKTVTITVKGDTKVEADEAFYVNLSAPVGATIADALGIGTIVNDDIAPIVLQAESATLTNATVAKQYAGYTGTGYAKFKDPAVAGDAVTWSASVPLGGTRTLQFRYANGGTAAKSLQLVINGAVVRSALSFAATGGWATWGVVSLTVPLTAGPTSIALVSTGGTAMPILDSLTVS
jgi:glucose/arabinose dehydrogenase